MLRIPLAAAAALSVLVGGGPRAASVSGPRALPPADSARLVLLGTGTPNADPHHQGPASAVVVGGQAYLVDAGTGIVRQAVAAAEQSHIPALRARRLNLVFLTHLHSDHTLGLPDLILTPWVLERPGPLRVYGPEGTRAMTRHILQAWRADIDNRRYGLEPINDTGWHVVVHRVRPGVVYRDSLVTVTAFPVKHGSWPEAFGYRFDTPDRSIVFSGDTRPTDAVVKACDGCDILVHEVYSAQRLKARSPAWQRYHESSHTSTVQLADIARRAHPKLLVLYHQLYWGATDADLIAEIRAAGYTGKVVSGHDLEVF